MGVFRTQSDIYDGTFCENSERLKVVRESSMNIKCYEDVSLQKNKEKKKRKFPITGFFSQCEQIHGGDV